MDNVIGWLVLKTKIDTKDVKGQIEKFKSNISSKLKDLFKSLNEGFKKFASVLNEIFKSFLFVGFLAGFMAVLGIIANAVKGILKETKSDDIEQIKAQIAYIANGLKGAILPLVQAVANVIRRILDYVIYIGEAWFGLSKYASNYKNEVKKANKETGKLRKELAKFDDVNVLNSDKGSGSGEIKIPEYKGMNGKPPAWLEWIAKNKKTIISALEGIAIGLLAWKLGLDAINPIGIGIAIVGICEAFETLLSYINDPSWEKFAQFLTWLGVAISGIGITIGAWPVIIGGALVAVLGIIMKNWDKIKKFIREKTDAAKEWLRDNFDIIGVMLGEMFDGLVSGIVTLFDDVFKGAKRFVDGIILIFKGDLTNGLIKAFDGIATILASPIEAAAKIIIGIINAIIGALNVMIRGLNKIKFDVPDWVPGIGGKKWGFAIKEIEKIPLATGGIVDIPKSGARLGNAVVGEAGAEGVLPLTDDATMTRLGQEIAKWIPINLNITNELDGRILSNRLETIRQNNSFSRNGG